MEHIEHIDYIAFTDAHVAADFRKAQGGWLFVEQDRKNFIWFNLKYTVSVILRHQALKGLSGKVTCYEEDIVGPAPKPKYAGTAIED